MHARGVARTVETGMIFGLNQSTDRIFAEQFISSIHLFHQLSTHRFVEIFLIHDLAMHAEFLGKYRVADVVQQL